MKQIITLIAVLSFGIMSGQGGLGSAVLSGNTTCANEYISISPCNGITSILYNGYTYDLVEIGGQCWFKENLQTTKYRDGSPIVDTLNNWATTTSGQYAWYVSDSATYAPTFGALYNWYAVNDTKGLCPTGWHVPTDCEWMYLENTLLMSILEQEATGKRGTNQGAMLKDTTTWDANINNNNSSGFTGRAGNYRYANGSFMQIGNVGDFGYWWCSKEDSMNTVWYRYLKSTMHTVYRHNNGSKNSGFSVRCMADSNTILTSLKEIQNFRALKIYPNPFSTSTIIELPNSKPYILNVYDLAGNKVRTKKVTGERLEIKKGNLTKGIYFFELRSENDTYKGKLLIE